MIRFFLSRVLAWLTELPWSDFLRIVRAAALANDKWGKDSAMSAVEISAIQTTRRHSVALFIQRSFPRLTGWKLNVVLELAVAWLNRTTKN